MVESLRILILEDNPTDAELVQFELQEAGLTFNSNVVKTEKDFVREIQDYCPDLILSDYDLPKYNGALALAEARKKCPDIPFILVTGAVTEDRAIEILTQGAKDYVLKTRLQQRLAPAVRRALAETDEHRARKKAEAELREAYRILERQVEERTSELLESKEHLSLALTSSGMGTFEWDITENRRHFDDSVCFLLGINPENFTGTAEEFFLVIHPDDRQAVQEALNKAAEQDKPYEMEYRTVWQDGSVHYIAARGKVLRDGAGRPLRMIGVCWEITERKLAEEEIQRNESRLRRLVDVLQHPSETIQDFLDYALEQAIQLTGSTIGYIYHYHEDRKEFVLNTWSKEVMAECAVANPPTCYELDKTGIWGDAVRQRRSIIVNDFQAAHPLKKGYPEGHVRLLKFMTVPIFRGKSIVGVVGLANKETDYKETDILQVSLLMEAVWKVTERKKAEEELRESEKRYRELSIVDDLTQLYNSRYFYIQLKGETERSNRYGQPLTLLLLDVDNFKSFNDAYGHIDGDQVLIRLGQVVKRCLRQTDSAYRYGGDEFIIILPMTTSADGTVTAKRIRTEFKREAFSPAPGQVVHVTVSIGLAQYKSQEDMKAFVYRVDQLMYQGKKNGGDRVCLEP